MNTLTEIKKEFWNSIKCGTGKAFIIQKMYPKINFKREIYKAAITNYAYDRQCEGSRGFYINQLIKNSKDSNDIQKMILDRFVIENEDFYNLDQMYDLAVLFYANGKGNISVREILRNRFTISPAIHNEFCGEHQILKVFGIDGILIIANVIGKHLLENEDASACSWKIEEFQKKNKGINVFELLEINSKNNEFVRKYYESITNNRSTIFKRRKIKKYSYKLISQRIKENKFMIISAERANELSDIEVLNLAKDFIDKKNINAKEGYLEFFRERKFPLDIKYLLSIIKTKKYKNTYYLDLACESLKFFKSKELRELLFTKIDQLNKSPEYLYLLMSNYEDGDGVFLNGIIDKCKNQHSIHRLTFILLDIYQYNNTKDCKGPLLKLYDTLTCGLCRKNVIEILDNNGVLSDFILMEIKYDSELDTRKFYKNRIKDRKQKVSSKL